MYDQSPQSSSKRFSDTKKTRWQCFSSIIIVKNLPSFSYGSLNYPSFTICSIFFADGCEQKPSHLRCSRFPRWSTTDGAATVQRRHFSICCFCNRRQSQWNRSGTSCVDHLRGWRRRRHDALETETRGLHAKSDQREERRRIRAISVRLETWYLTKYVKSASASVHQSFQQSLHIFSIFLIIFVKLQALKKAGNFSSSVYTNAAASNPFDTTQTNISASPLLAFCHDWQVSVSVSLARFLQHVYLYVSSLTPTSRVPRGLTPKKILDIF